MKNLLHFLKRVNKLVIYLISMSLLTTVTSCKACKNESAGNSGHQEKEEQIDPIPPQVILSSNTTVCFLIKKSFKFS